MSSRHYAAAYRLVGAVLCTAVALQSATVVEAAQTRSKAGAAFVETTDEGSHRATLKKAEGQVVIAAVRIAFAQRAGRRADSALLRQISSARRASAWRFGATFARMYVPHRQREIFAPPSTSDPDA